jgi:hypothetical protein
MLEIGTGPWAVKFNGETLQGIEAADVSLEQDTVDIETLEGTKTTKTRMRSAEVVITAVDTGIDNLKKILPDNWIADATQIEGQPVGVVVSSTKGAIVYGKPTCGEAQLTAPLQLVPCGNPDEHTITLFDGVAEITGVSLDDGVKKVEVTIRSEAVGVLVALGNVDLDESGS